MLAISALVLGIVFGTHKDTVMYDVSVREALLQPPSDRILRVQGILRRGSLCKVVEPCQFRMVVDGSGGPGSDLSHALEVRYDHCTLPDTLAYDAPGIDTVVTAEGTLGPNHQLHATAVFAKCPAKYYWARDASAPSRLHPIPLCH
jgi:cytochrome c-type biogenesis protein CcmE